MARNLEEFKQDLAGTVKTGEAMARQGLPEPLPPLIDPALDAQLRVWNEAFDKIFGKL